MPAATPPRTSASARTRARSRPAEPASLLGDGFAVGVATSGYQVEGGFNGDGEPHNNWAAWEGAGRAARSGLACDFWRHPEEALDRAAAIGCNAFRLSVEWARLEPQPGVVDAAALERYAEILSLCTARGMEPIVTLHHFTHPWWLGEEFWLRPGSPDVFARHVARVVPALARYCRRWVTVSEAFNIVTLMGWIEGACPPGRRMAVSDAFCALDNLLTAHVLAADAVTAVQPEAEVTVNTSSSSVYEHDRMLLDLVRLRDADVDPGEVDRYIDERRVVHDAAFPPRHAGEAAIRRFFAAGIGLRIAGRAGRGAVWSALPVLRRGGAPRQVVAAVQASARPRSLDAVGFDWNDPVASHALRVPGRRTPAGGRDWSFGRAYWDVESHPAGLRNWCVTESTPAAQSAAVGRRRDGMATWLVHGQPKPCRTTAWTGPATCL